MVEDQQSIKTVLSFGAKSVDPAILEQLLVGREKNAEYLFNALEGIVENGNNHQVLIIGQRGMGKTHLLRLLYHRCQRYINEKRLVVAYFSEEEYGVSDYFDFLTRILYAFIRWNSEDLAFLDSKLGQLQESPPSAQSSLLEDIIREYISDRPLLILAENFADMLNGMGAKEQGKLRAWIYENRRVSIIASSQALSDDFDMEDRPFYGFFQLYYLKSLSFQDSLNFLVSMAELDQRPDIVTHIGTKGKSQVRAIHDLVKGNHRLLVTFYEFLKSDTLAKLSSHFIKTINDLKPYYETYIRYLPPQQQKILRYIALARTPQPGTTISKNCFIDPKSLSKQLSELTKKKLVEIISDQEDKRNKLYDIHEPLLRISIEVGEHKEGVTALFVDFLSLFYEVAEENGEEMSGAIHYFRKEVDEVRLRSETFFGSFEKLEFEKKIVGWRTLVKLPDPYFVGKLSSTLQSDVTLYTERMKPVLIEWVNNILTNATASLTRGDLEIIRTTFSPMKVLVPELAVSLSYIDVFEEFFFDGNKNAPYSLPKEQRLFFQKNILQE